MLPTFQHLAPCGCSCHHQGCLTHTNTCPVCRLHGRSSFGVLLAGHGHGPCIHRVPRPARHEDELFLLSDPGPVGAMGNVVCCLHQRWTGRSDCGGPDVVWSSRRTPARLPDKDVARIWWRVELDSYPSLAVETRDDTKGSGERLRYRCSPWDQCLGYQRERSSSRCLENEGQGSTLRLRVTPRMK